MTEDFSDVLKLCVCDLNFDLTTVS